jgi:hypothetical protein
MNMTQIQQPALRLITVKARSFPEGIRPAWQELEKKRVIKGRKAYGLIYAGAAGMDYYAGLVSDGEIEERVTGLPVVEVPAGPCVRVKLMDWNQHVDQIALLFGQMIAAVQVDPDRPAMEYYRSFTELHLLVPVMPAEA